MDVNLPASASHWAEANPAYPSHLVAQRRLPDGTVVLIRPIAADDGERHRRFLNSLSLQTRYQRLLSARRLLPGELQRLVAIDYRHELALIATVPSPAGEQEAGVARFVRHAAGTAEDAGDAEDADHVAEFAIVVQDDWQHRGLGRLLLCSLIDAAQAAGIERLAGTTLATNASMLRLARRLGFSVSAVPGDWTLRRLAIRPHFALTGPQQAGPAATLVASGGASSSLSRPNTPCKAGVTVASRNALTAPRA